MQHIQKPLKYLKGSHQYLTKFIRTISSVKSGVPYKHIKKDEDPILTFSLPNEADVVVIGGGSLGCHTVYHLTKLGVKSVVLLEKDQITAGTTWHTAGLIWRLRATDTEIELQAHTRHLAREVLQAETGVDTGWIENGGLFIASKKERLEEYKRLHTLGKAFNIESYILSPEDTKKLYPLINEHDLYGALYSPGDGVVDPSGICTALTRAARASGAKIIEKCPVLGIRTYEDDFGVSRVAAVDCALGTIKTANIVNCTGVWAPTIGKMAGVHVPLVALKHAYVVTNRIEGIQNMPNIRDHDFSIYLRLQGDSLCIGGYEPNPIPWKKVQNDFAFSLFDLDWDVFEVHLNNAMKRVPVLEKTGIRSTVCGPESFTADHKPIMGEDPLLRGFFHGCGFNSGGMMLGGGCGRELAKWVVHGRPELDMYGYDIRRFPPELTGNSSWVQQRSHESYCRHYTIAYPNDEPLAGRNILMDPFHKELLNAGCVFQQRLGWERPGWFFPEEPAPILDYDYYGCYDVPQHENYIYKQRLEDEYTFDFSKHHERIGKECLNCRNNVSVFNMSYFGKYYLVGPDVQKAANWIFTNDINKPNNSVIYTCMLNEQGKIEADLTVSPVTPGEGSACDPEFEGEKGFYVAAGGGSAYQNLCHINKVISDRGFNVHILDRSKEMGMLSIQGPKSRELLQMLTDSDLSDKAFPFSTHKIIHIGEHKVRALRLTFVGELGWELHIPKASCIPVYRLLMEKGQKLGVANAGYRAIDSLSIEKGYRHWHADIRMDDTPLEVGLGFTCKLKQDIPFLGRSALEKQQKEGVRKRLACFTIDEYVPLWGLEAIWRDGEVVGFIRRAGFAYSLGRSIGYGCVRRPDGGVVDKDFLKKGEFQLERMEKLLPAKIHLRSPFDPDNKRVKGVYDGI